MDEHLQESIAIARKVFGISDEKTDADVENILGVVESVLGAAFDAGFTLYHPLFGIENEAGVASPSDAAEIVLRDVLDAAPMYPDWARVNGADEDDAYVVSARMELHDCVSRIIDGVLYAVSPACLGWVDGDYSDEDIIDAGVDFLTTLVASRGAGGATLQ